MISRREIVQPHYTRAGPSLLAAEPADPMFRPEPGPSWWPVMYMHLEARMQAFYTWRLPWWQHWGEIARYELPYRYHAFITANTYDRGLRRDNLIIDETATLAGRVCAAGMMSGLTDPDRPWLKLGPKLPGTELDQAGQIWFDDLTDGLRWCQQNSNFYDSLATAYEDLVFMGNGVTIDYEHDEDLFHSVNYCAGEYFLGAGHDFSDEVLYAEFRLTVAQIVERYGLAHCPDDVTKAWAQKGAALESEFVVGHAIEPNFAVKGQGGVEAGVVPGGFTWREFYWLRGKGGTTGPLSMAGFHEKPFSVMQWNRVSNDPYARGPGSDALGGTIQLQVQTRAEAEAMEKVNRPPMIGPAVLQNLPNSTKPDGITYVNAVDGKPAFHPAYEIRPDIPAIRASITAVQQRIERTFYNPLFRAIEMLRSEVRGAVTATEIDALKSEQLMQLGPVIGRVLETIRGRIHRQLAIMHRAGLIPPIPDSVRRAGVKVEFVSMLTQAQRATSVAAIDRAWAFVEQIAPLAPDARLVLDEVESARERAELLGVPARIIRAPQKVQQLIQAAAQKAQADQAAQLAQAGVEGAKSLGQASVTPQTALGQLMGQGQQAAA